MAEFLLHAAQRFRPILTLPRRLFMMRLTRFTVCVLSLVLFPLVAEASSIAYTNQAAWSAATSIATLIDFENIVPDNGSGGVPTLSGVAFVAAPGSNSTLYLIGDNVYYPNNSVLSTQGSLTGIDGPKIIFPTPVTSFAVRVGGFNFSAASMTVGLSNGDSFIGSVGVWNGFDFFGVTSTVPFSFVTLTAASNSVGTVVNFDDVRFGTAATTEITATPEPASLFLFGTGMLTMARWYRRRK